MHIYKSATQNMDSLNTRSYYITMFIYFAYIAILYIRRRIKNQLLFISCFNITASLCSSNIHVHSTLSTSACTTCFYIGEPFGAGWFWSKIKKKYWSVFKSIIHTEVYYLSKQDSYMKYWYIVHIMACMIKIMLTCGIMQNCSCPDNTCPEENSFIMTLSL